MTESLPESASGGSGSQAGHDARRVAPAPAWEEKPVPPGHDPHPPHACWSGTFRGPVEVIAARARGRKHKHLGQHCDDWYEIGAVDRWTLIAVADGAGSRSLSRVGARAACEAAVDFLTRRLATPALRSRVLSLFGRLIRRGTSGSDPLERARLLAADGLVGAMRSAHSAVALAASRRRDDPEIRRALGRAPTVDDLATTLTLAVHRTVRLGGTPISLVASCQVGDGVVAAVTAAGGPGVVTLGTPDAGEYAGQTEFLTGLADTDGVALYARVASFVGPLRMLLVATDGVGDDYFPPDPGLLRLGADLEAIGVVPPVGASGRSSPEEKLLGWLDGYHVRGSFDDRTLVVLNPGGHRAD